VSDWFDDVDLATHRREARERTVSLLYEAEMKSVTSADVIDALPIVPDALVIELTVGVWEFAESLDEQVAACLDKTWTMARLAVLDRLVLRLAAYELIHRPQVPKGAVINEAVELAKYFSGPEAARFVNGVLSSVARNARD
jgi:N utilization substance protein B